MAVMYRDTRHQLVYSVKAQTGLQLHPQFDHEEDSTFDFISMRVISSLSIYHVERVRERDGDHDWSFVKTSEV